MCGCVELGAMMRENRFLRCIHILSDIIPELFKRQIFAQIPIVFLRFHPYHGVQISQNDHFKESVCSLCRKTLAIPKDE